MFVNFICLNILPRFKSYWSRLRWNSAWDLFVRVLGIDFVAGLEAKLDLICVQSGTQLLHWLNSLHLKRILKMFFLALLQLQRDLLIAKLEETCDVSVGLLVGQIVLLAFCRFQNLFPTYICWYLLSLEALPELFEVRLVVGLVCLVLFIIILGKSGSWEIYIVVETYLLLDRCNCLLGRFWEGQFPSLFLAGLNVLDEFREGLIIWLFVCFGLVHFYSSQALWIRHHNAFIFAWRVSVEIWLHIGIMGADQIWWVFVGFWLFNHVYWTVNYLCLADFPLLI